MIIGCSGAGKSTLARKLQQITGLPLIHLDQEYWRPNWIESTKAEWKGRVEELVEKDSWIMDGNYGGTMEIRLKKADTIIFLHYPRWLCLYRVIKRILVNYGKIRPDMPEGCPEKWDWKFIQWIYRYEKKKTPQIYERLKKVRANQKILVFKNPRQTEQFLSSLKMAESVKPSYS